jgi:hypothetical protein
MLDEDSDKTPSPPPQITITHKEIPTKTTPKQTEPQNDPQPSSEKVQPENTQEKTTTPPPEHEPENQTKLN